MFKTLLLPRISTLSSTLVVALSCAGSLHAQVFDPTLTITMPDQSIAANSSASFDLFVNNTGSARTVNGIGVYLETASGGPSITGVDVLTGTIFGAVANNGQNGVGTGNQGIPTFFYQETSTTSGNTVTVAPGLSKFASATFNTTGVAPGTYSYTLNSSFGPSFYTTTGGDINPTIVAGTLTVVPEPEATALVAGALCAFLLLRPRCASHKFSSQVSKRL
jgi:hypothetical protein